MCGIAGAFVTEPKRLDTRTAVGRAMLKIMHRGPDDRGLFVSDDGRCAIAQTRLAIIDLSPGGWQPMGTPDGRFWIVFNGEIYNYKELRGELRTTGRAFRSQSDTEVLLAAWETWGTSCLQRLVGMFAFAVLDRSERRLTLVRDFFGIKPLYWTRNPSGFAFASEISALLHLANPAR